MLNGDGDGKKPFMLNGDRFSNLRPDYPTTRGIDGSCVERFTDNKHSATRTESQTPLISEAATDFQDISCKGGVKSERECVMRLSEDMSMVFIPCAHQINCTTCNELHEKQGMEDCPSCRSLIQRRIPVRYARS
ncbi:hypothetical protein F3Y22_tig00110257pilonHSYRG00083 [Hibiscus syriacus]|uniref:RING-type domain-containing protein n=1 Tax=Hibiscus syriacus TaxID=106335 RepID=A0A6A3BA67_HIBSY|nr:hypothetical protein F3Y22_tig00110257pilonHSYRG00083 [Hibiscus syriacus]